MTRGLAALAASAHAEEPTPHLDVTAVPALRAARHSGEPGLRNELGCHIGHDGLEVTTVAQKQIVPILAK